MALCLGIADITVKAEEQAFTIDAQMLPSDQSAYEVQLTVENQGQDWEGTVRLRILEQQVLVLMTQPYRFLQAVRNNL